MQIDLTDMLAKRTVSFPREKARVVWPIGSTLIFAADPRLSQLTSSSSPQPSRQAQARPLSRPNSAQYRTRANHNTNGNLSHGLLHPPIGTHDLRLREVQELRYTEGDRRVAHHSVLLSTCADASAAGDHAAGCSGGRGEGGRVWRNTQRAVAAAAESVYRVDLKRADPDPGLLDGDDEGGEGRRSRRSSACVTLIHHGKGCQKVILVVGEWRGPVLRPGPAHGRGRW